MYPMKLFVCINYMMVVQNIWQSPSFYQGLPCFLPTSPATALFGWCRHELNIQSMDGVGTHPTHPQTCRALVARSSANFTPTANPLLANLFHSLPSCKTSRSYLDALLLWQQSLLLCTEGRKGSG